MRAAHPEQADASPRGGLFALILVDKAGHARAAFGAAELPLNAAVELVVTARVRD